MSERAQLGGAEAEQGGEPSHRVAASVEAEHELVEIVVEMIRPDAMMRAVHVLPWPHVHVTGNGGTAKIWLRSVELEKSRGYPDPQIGRILRITGEHQAEWLAEWEKRCGSN